MTTKLGLALLTKNGRQLFVTKCEDTLDLFELSTDKENAIEFDDLNVACLAQDLLLDKLCIFVDVVDL
jgi:hypothetical protein